FVAKWSFRQPHLAATLYVTLLLSGLLLGALAVQPNETVEQLRQAWLQALSGPLRGAVIAYPVVVLVLVVQSFRDRVGWGFGLLRIAWGLPGSLIAMAVILLGLRLFEVVVQSGSVVLMAVAGAIGVALVWAAWRSRVIRAFLNRPAAFWSRMLVVVVCAAAAPFAILLIWALLKSG